MSDKISIYDPSADAYREVELEVALKFIESAEELKARLASAEGQQ